MTLRRVDDFDFPELPKAIPDIGGAAPTLALSGTAPDRLFFIEGEVAEVNGDVRSGSRSMSIAGLVAATGPRLAGTAGLNFVASPGSLRREVIAGGATFVESTQVAPTLPLVVTQWSLVATAPQPFELTLLPECTDLVFDQKGAVLVVRDADDAESQVAVGLHGSGQDWEVVESDLSGLTVRNTLPASGLVTLVVSAGPARRIASAFAAVAHLGAHTSRMTDRPPDAVRTRTRVASLDDAVGWATARLARTLRRSEHDLRRLLAGPTGAAAFWSGVGSLAAGDADGALIALTALEAASESDEPSQAWRGCQLAPFLAARIGLATGNTRPARVHAERLLEDPAPPIEVEGHDLRSVTAHALADALRYAESAATVEKLRSLAATPRPRPGRQLPVLTKSRKDVASFLTSCWADTASVASVPSTEDPSLDRVLTAWATTRHEPDARWLAWRTELSLGLEHGPAGPGTWDTATAFGRPGAPVAGALLAVLVHGLVGFAPDSPSGRARIAPNLPSHLTAFDVENLRLDDTSIRMLYERDGSRHRFELSPVVARMPPMIVFEPTVSGTRLAGASVDGSEADLDSVSTGARIQIRLQIPLDATRVIEFTVE